VDKSQLSNLQLKTMHEVLQHPTLNRVVVPYTLGNGSVPANKVAATSDSGLLITDHAGNVTNSLLREGSAAVGGGGNFGPFTPRAAVTANAQTWFIAKFIPTSGATGDAVFDSAARVTVVQGDPLSAISATAKMGSYLAVSASSSVGVFRSTLTGVLTTENEALWSATSGGAPTLLLQKGKLLPPSSTLKLAKLIRYWPVGSTQVVAHIQVSGVGVTTKNNIALVLIQANGQVQFLLRTGDSAPGYPSGALISAISSVDVEPVNGFYAVLASISGVSATANHALFRGETSLGDDITQQALRLPKRVLKKGAIYASPFTPQGSVKGIVMAPAVEASGAGARGLRRIINSSGHIAVTIIGDRSSSELVVIDP
jgi:hypothetical protein